MSLSHPSGWGVVQGDERTAVFKEAGTLLAELREIADLDPPTLVYEHALEPFTLTPQDRTGLVKRLHVSTRRASSLVRSSLPPEKRQAVRALYAFCRTSDDLVDRPGSELARGLATWSRACA